MTLPTLNAHAPFALASILACLVGGFMVARGLALPAVALIAFGILVAGTILQRQRMTAAIWAGVAFTAPLQGVRLAPSLALSDVLIIGAFLTILPDGIRGWRRRVPRGVIPAFGLLLSAGLVGTFFAPSAASSLANVVRLVLAAAGSVAAMSLWDPEVAQMRRFAWLWFAGAATSAVWAIVTPRPFVGRAIGLTNHPNHLSLTCLLGVGLGLGLALSSSGARRIAALFGVVLLGVGIALSGARAGIFGLAVTVGLTAVLTRRFRLLTATGVAAILGTMAAVVGILRLPDTSALARLTGGGGSGASDLERKQRLAEAFATIVRRPLTGEGFEEAQAAHNIYLQALVVGGPLALIGFLGVSGLILRAGLRATRAQRKQSDGPVLAGLTAGYAGYLLYGAFEPILWDRYLWTYIGLLLLLAASTHHSTRANSSAEPPVPLGWTATTHLPQHDHPVHSARRVRPSDGGATSQELEPT